MKDKTIENSFVLSKNELHGCEEGFVPCYWKDLKTAKSKCKEWPKCGMLKEAKDSIGFKLYLAVEITARQTDIQHSFGDQLWILVEAGTCFISSILSDNILIKEYSITNGPV